MSRGAALLSEGQCPNGHGPLERREGWGFCAGCDHLWRIRGDVMECAVEITADFNQPFEMLSGDQEGTSG